MGIKNINIKYENLNYSSADFDLKNSKGQIHGYTIVVGVKGNLEMAELAPGGEIEGIIVFEEIIDDIGLILSYKDIFDMFQDEPTFNFKIS